MKSLNLLILMIVLIFTSCTKEILRTKVPYTSDSINGKVGVLTVAIGKPLQPILPLIDASAFNGKMNKISDEIIDVQLESIPKFSRTFEQELLNRFSFEVLNSDQLALLNGYSNTKELYHNKESLITGNDNYPLILIGENDILPFQFKKGKFIEYLTGDLNYSNVIADICEKLQIDGIAINVTHINVSGVSSFGISSNSRLNSSIFLFNKQGKLVGHTDAFSKILVIKGKDIQDFKSILNFYQPLIINALNDMKSTVTK